MAIALVDRFSYARVVNQRTLIKGLASVMRTSVALILAPWETMSNQNSVMAFRKPTEILLWHLVGFLVAKLSLDDLSRNYVN